MTLPEQLSHRAAEVRDARLAAAAADAAAEALAVTVAAELHRHGLGAQRIRKALGLSSNSMAQRLIKLANREDTHSDDRGAHPAA